MSKKDADQKLPHTVPRDLQKALDSSTKKQEAWDNITPLGRNEFICWIEDAKKLETREHRINRTVTEILEGKRRPCCWAGCIHRSDKAMSPSQKWVYKKK